MEILLGRYQIYIVILSITAAIFGAYVTLSMNEKIDRTESHNKSIWLLLASLSFGITVWVAHFIGMLAFYLPGIEITYDLKATLLSVIPSLLGAFVAFLTLYYSKKSLGTILLSGFLMGIGIVSMHYIGMSAIRFAGMYTYSRPHIILSIIIATVTSFIGLLIFNTFKNGKSSVLKWISSGFIGVSITGMHYTGMSGMTFCGTPASLDAIPPSDNFFGLIHAVSIGTIIVFMILYIIAIVDWKNAVKLAMKDDLTKLPNLRSFEQYMKRKNSKQTSSFSLILFDIDNFKWINETFGYPVGNAVIKEFASRFKSILNKADFFGRLDGNQFMIVCDEQSSHEQIKVLMEKLLHTLKEPFHVHSHSILVSASAGISLSPEDGRTAAQLIHAAKGALKHVKTNGKNFYMFYEPKLHDDHWEREISVHFLQALQDNEFTMHYQPKYSPRAHRIIGAEALVRWNSEKFGNVPPDKFIPIAEKNGFIFPLTEWVLETVCKQMRKWLDSGSPIQKVAVNISAHHFLANGLEALILDSLERNHLEGKYLELEITETSYMENMEAAKNTIMKLRRYGITVALDDFGTGISSLTYLKILPIQTLKIDKAFIDGAAESKVDEALVKMIIEIARLMKLKVVAEGVETKDQLDLLAELGTDEIQGYYISKPLSEPEFQQFLERFSN